ncbi:MAG: lyase [Chthonomonadaceae bacterium]|nr:lyase [Chthonomonadaceae bacterium]
MDKQLEQYIARLKDADPDVRRSAANALGKIGGPSVTLALIESLKDENYLVRQNAVIALRKIGDASAIPALIQVLPDEDDYVRREVAAALNKIGTSAVPALIEALKDKEGRVRWRAAEALKRIGDSDTLPRKILASSRWSARERIDVLEKLRHVHKAEWTLHYTIPETRTLCQIVLNETDADASKGAQSVLEWLKGGQYLLRASQPDPSKQSEELVRPVRGGEPEMSPDSLLRASDGSEEDVSPPLAKPRVWERLFGKRSSGNS